MTSTISLEGLAASDQDDGRSIAHLKVQYRGTTYDWQLYVDPGADLQTFIQNCNQTVEAQIDAKEALWAALTPKTRTTTDPMTDDIVVIDIPKEEIVRPDVPDYKSFRAKGYPRIGDQLDALWKGYGTPSFTKMQLVLCDNKIQFPKGVTEDDKLNSVRADVWNKVVAVRQQVVEGGAKVAVDGVDKWFNSDTFSRTQWLGMVVLGASLPPNISWRAMDGSYVTITPTIVQQIFTAIMTKEVIAFGNGTRLYAQILTSSDPTTIDINVGWPESYPLVIL